MWYWNGSLMFSKRLQMKDHFSIRNPRFFSLIFNGTTKILNTLVPDGDNVFSCKLTLNLQSKFSPEYLLHINHNWIIQKCALISTPWVYANLFSDLNSAVKKKVIVRTKIYFWKAGNDKKKSNAIFIQFFLCLHNSPATDLQLIF